MSRVEDDLETMIHHSRALYECSQRLESVLRSLRGHSGAQDCVAALEEQAARCRRAGSDMEAAAEQLARHTGRSTGTGTGTLATPGTPATPVTPAMPVTPDTPVTPGGNAWTSPASQP